ncbi:MAG: hypothetical protein NXY57DRAFT_962794 [Lentinula lateritia]|nr:MAG: hypothetical protein NXY57DRAFT_962794 [Lentinula lateritia]
MENSGVLLDLEVNKDLPELTGDLHSLSPFFQSLPAISGLSGTDSQWPQPLLFPAWEDMLRLDNVTGNTDEFQPFPVSHWNDIEVSFTQTSEFEASTTHAGGLGASTAHAIHDDTWVSEDIHALQHDLDVLLSQADWVAPIASQVDWSTILPPQIGGDVAPNGSTILPPQIGSDVAPNGSTILPPQVGGDVAPNKSTAWLSHPSSDSLIQTGQVCLPVELSSTSNGSTCLEATNTWSSLSIAPSSTATNGVYDNIGTSPPVHDNIQAFSETADMTPLPRSSSQPVLPASPTNNTAELLSLFPQPSPSLSSRSRPRSHIRKLKPYDISAKRSKTSNLKAEEMDLVAVEVKDFKDLCRVFGVSYKDLTFLAEHNRSCYDRYQNYRIMRDFLVCLGFTKDKTWKSLTRMGVLYTRSETQHFESLTDILDRCKWHYRTWEDKRQYYNWAEDAPKYKWNDLYPRSEILEGMFTYFPHFFHAQVHDLIGINYIQTLDPYNHFVRIKYAFDQPGFFILNHPPRRSGGDYYETRTAELVQESIKKYRKAIDKYIIKVDQV